MILFMHPQKERKMRRFMLLLLVFLISCSQKNEKSKYSDKYSEINSKRTEFLKVHFSSFKRDVDDASFYLNQYENLKEQAINLSGKDIQPLNQLEHAFKVEHGKDLIEIQKLLKNYEVDSDHLQQILKTLKDDIEVISTRYNENLASFNLCKEEATNYKSAIEKKRDDANESINKLKREFDSYVSSAKSHSDSASDWKKKVAHSNWPPDKNKYAKKASKLAEKAKSYAVKANDIYDAITVLITQTKTEISNNVEKLNQKFSLCKDIHSQLSNDSKILEDLAFQYKETSDQLLSINNKVKQLFSDNQVLFKHFDEFKLQRDMLIGTIKDRLAERILRFEQAHQKNIENYGPEYLHIYKKIGDWLSKSYVDGKETFELLEYLRQFDSIKVKVLYKSIYEILESSVSKKITKLPIQINRNIASLIYIEIGDIKIPSLPNIKIELPSLPEIKIDLPSLHVELPKFKLDLSHINVSLPQFTLTQALPNITFELPEFMYFKLDKISVKADFPELKVGQIRWDITGDIGHLFEKVKSIRVSLPSIELIRIEADVWGDIQKPERIIQNTVRESSKSAQNVYRELGNGVKEMRRVYLQSMGVDFNKLMKQLKIGVGVCRQQKGLVQKQVNEIKTVVDLLEAKRTGNISDDEYSRRYEKMLKETEIFQGYGLTAASIGSLASSSYLTHLVFSMSASSLSSTTMIVGKIGLVGIGVAVALNYMASSAQKELAKEHDKINECSGDLRKLIDELNNIQAVFIQDEIDGKSLLAQVNKRIQQHKEELFQMDFNSDDYVESMDQLDQKVHKDMLQFKQSSLLLGDKQTLKLITDFLNSIGLEI